jgi:hypothetical protein
MRVFNTPVPVNGRHHLVEPVHIGKLLCQHVTRIVFHAITLWPTQRLNQARLRQGRDDVRGDPSASATSSLVMVARYFSNSWIFNGESAVIHFPWLQ